MGYIKVVQIARFVNIETNLYKIIEWLWPHKAEKQLAQCSRFPLCHKIWRKISMDGTLIKCRLDGALDTALGKTECQINYTFFVINDTGKRHLEHCPKLNHTNTNLNFVFYDVAACFY